jgi:hypothetical protein
MSAAPSDDVRYFSNGTEGYGWMAENCDRCTHDHINHRPDADDPGCPHIASLFFGTHDPVFIPEMTKWTDKNGVEREYVGTWTCIEFSRCACDRGPDDPGVEPKPTPDPNQGALFDTGELMPGVWRDVVLDTFPTDRLGGVPAFPAEATFSPSSSTLSGGGEAASPTP